MDSTPDLRSQEAFDLQTELMTKGLEGGTPPDLSSSDPMCAVWMQLILDNAAAEIIKLKRQAESCRKLENENAELKQAIKLALEQMRTALPLCE